MFVTEVALNTLLLRHGDTVSKDICLSLCSCSYIFIIPKFQATVSCPFSFFSLLVFFFCIFLIYLFLYIFLFPLSCYYLIDTLDPLSLFMTFFTFSSPPFYFPPIFFCPPVSVVPSVSDLPGGHRHR